MLQTQCVLMLVKILLCRGLGLVGAPPPRRASVYISY